MIPEDTSEINQSTTLAIVVQDENDTEESPIRFEIEAPEGSSVSSGGSTYKNFRCTPPTGPNSFFFAYIFTKKRPRRRSRPPPRPVTSPCPQPEILDPPLVSFHQTCRETNCAITVEKHVRLRSFRLK